MGCWLLQTDSQNDLVLLFQFIHLNGLYTPGQGFAPPILPSVVANATGQEVAAVRTLYDSFSNGPLLGGHGDALEKLSKIASESTEDVIPGVSCACSLSPAIHIRSTRLIPGFLTVDAQTLASESSSQASHLLQKKFPLLRPPSQLGPVILSPPLLTALPSLHPLSFKKVSLLPSSPLPPLRRK